MTTPNDDKASALIESLVPKLLDSLKDGVSDLVQKEITPLLENHEKLKDEFHEGKRNAELLTKLQEQIEGLTGKPVEKPAPKALECDPTRFNPTQWQSLKAKADELGVPIYKRGTQDAVYTPQALLDEAG